MRRLNIIQIFDLPFLIRTDLLKFNILLALRLSLADGTRLTLKKPDVFRTDKITAFKISPYSFSILRLTEEPTEKILHPPIGRGLSFSGCFLGRNTLHGNRLFKNFGHDFADLDLIAGLKTVIHITRTTRVKVLSHLGCLDQDQRFTFVHPVTVLKMTLDGRHKFIVDDFMGNDYRLQRFQRYPYSVSAIERRILSALGKT